jgi:hypothetical protein
MEQVRMELKMRPLIPELRRVENRFDEYATSESVRHILMKMEGYVTMERYNTLKIDNNTEFAKLWRDIEIRAKRDEMNKAISDLQGLLTDKMKEFSLKKTCNTDRMESQKKFDHQGTNIKQLKGDCFEHKKDI